MKSAKSSLVWTSRILLSTLLTVVWVALSQPALAQKPSFDSLYSKAEEALAAEDLDQAVLLFEKLVGFFPESSIAHNRLGLVHYKRGNDGRAIFSFRKALSLSRTNEEAQHNLILASGRHADNLVRESRFAEASRILDELISTYAWHPQVSALLYYRGRLEFFRGSPDEGLKWWRKAAEKAPESGVAAVINAENRSTFDDGTLRLYQRAIDRVPSEPSFSYLLGRRLQARAGSPEETFQALFRGIEVARESQLPFPLLSLATARAALTLGRADEAVNLLEEAKRQRPDWASLRALLWLAYLEKGQGAQADQALQEAFELDSSPRLGLIGSGAQSVTVTTSGGNQSVRPPLSMTVTPGPCKVTIGDQSLTLELSEDNAALVRISTDQPPELVSKAKLIATRGQSGQLAPPLVAKDRRGRIYRLADQLLKKPVVILFWNSEDPEANSHLANFGALSSRWGDRIEAVSIHSNPETQKDALRLYLSQPANTAQLWGDPRILELFNIEEVPAILVIDGNGRIVLARQDVPRALSGEIHTYIEENLLD